MTPKIPALPPAYRRPLAALAGATGLSGAAALLNLVAGVLIARTLPTAHVARYTLLLAALQLIILVGGLGQPALIRRLYSLKPPGAYRWPADLTGGLGFSAPALALGVLAAWRAYRLPPGQVAFLALAVLALAVGNLQVEVLNAHRLYIRASLLQHLPNAAMILPAGLSLLAPALAAPGLARLEAMLAGQLLAAAAAVLLGFESLRRRIISGPERIPPAARWQGLAFGALLATYLVPYQGLIAIAGRLTPPEALAAYGALGQLIRPFYLFQGVLGQILTVEVARRRELPGRWLEAALWGLFAALLGAGLWLLPPVARLVYGGRYQEFSTLLAPLLLSGALLVPEALPRSFITGRGSARALHAYTATQIGIAVAGIGLAFWSGARAGVLGIAWTGAAMLGLRVAAAYLFYTLERRPAPETSPV